MSTELITGNDLKSILNEVLPPTPSEYRKLLWTNPSSQYSTGTISLDLTDYDEIEILFYADDSLATAFYSRTKVGKSGHAQWWDVRTDLSNLNNINSVTRNYSVSTSGVTFQNGNMIYNGASYAGWAGRCVPYQIYGIKYERVAPPQLEVPQKIELLRVSSGLANTNYTLGDNISNYDIISIVALSSYSNRWGTMIPASVFAESTDNYQLYLGVEPNVYYLALRYTNSTTITVTGHGTATIGVVITGFKL